MTRQAPARTTYSFPLSAFREGAAHSGERGFRSSPPFLTTHRKQHRRASSEVFRCTTCRRSTVVIRADTDLSQRYETDRSCANQRHSRVAGAAPRGTTQACLDAWLQEALSGCLAYLFGDRVQYKKYLYRKCPGGVVVKRRIRFDRFLDQIYANFIGRAKF